MRLISGKLRNKIADSQLRSAIRKRILSVSPARQLFAPQSYLSPDEAAALVQRFAEQNAMVARDFLGRPDGQLFQDALPKQEPERKDDAAPEILLERLIDLLPALLRGKEEQLIGGPKADIASKREAPPVKQPTPGGGLDMTSL